MYSNYLKIAVRNLSRNKLYSILNILGLSIGIISAVLIMLYVQDELSYDTHYDKHERIYRLSSDFSFSGQDDQAALTPMPMGFAMKDDYPEIEEVARIMPSFDKRLFKYENKEFYEEDVLIADSTYFKLFNHRFLMGTPEEALTKPYDLVVTESFAEKYFGDDDPIGKTIISGTGSELNVVAVIEDVPENSHLKFSALLSMKTLSELYGENFDARQAGTFWRVNVYTYLMLTPEGDIDELLKKFPELYDKYMGEIGDQINGSFNIMAHDLADLHLYSNLHWDEPTGNLSYVLIFALVGVCILLIACFNYMNLATARSTKRAREVGIRKVLGASKVLIVRQFISESVLMSFLALLVAVGFIALLLPTFNILAGKSFEFSVLFEPIIILEMILLTLLIGIISGSYPAFYLSSLIPANVLKGNSSQTKGSFLRKTLVVLQFAISTVMIIGTLIVNDQLNFLQSKDMGFDKENVVVSSMRDTTISRSFNAFRDELLQNPNIKNVTTSTSIPGTPYGKVVFRVENAGKMEELVVDFVFAEHQFKELMDLKLVQGRFFDKDRTTDEQSAVIINETAAKQYGWEDNPIGKRVHYGVNLNGPPIRDMKVIGVVKDFHFASLHEPIEPLFILLDNQHRGLINIRIDDINTASTLDFIQKTYKKFEKKYPFEYDFMDDLIGEFYSDEQKMSKIFTVFAIICIFISCLGLIGLSTFIAEQRTKEIGIRKVMGATMSNIIVLMSTDFLKLVLISNIIAWPVAYLALSGWLEDFAYRIDMGFLSFIIASIAAVIIALLTISYQSVKSALLDPIESIKYE